jgi:hypothetical protein
VRDPPPTRSGSGGLGGWMRLKMGYWVIGDRTLGEWKSETACILY